jgi:PEP-CTERM motif
MNGSVRRTRIVFLLAVMGLMPAPGLAGPLDPNAFSSLGAFPSLSGSYSINTSAAMAPTLTEPGGATITGVYYQDSPGHTVAVFDFSSISMTSSQTITATGAAPVALLSRGDATIGGTINVNGSGSSGGAGALYSGVGVGLSNSYASGSGGGFGGNGGASGAFTYNNPPSTAPSVPGGQAYGDLSVSLQGGSQGGLSGGGGGGGLEIGAIGTLTIPLSGFILAEGASESVGAGGGSGGGVFLHASIVNYDGAILAIGGDGGANTSQGGMNGGSGGGGGGGSGGRVLIEYSSGISILNPIDVAGGFGGASTYGTTNGMAGTVSFISVPEPSSLALVTMGVVIGLGCRWRHHRRQPSGG